MKAIFEGSALEWNDYNAELANSGADVVVVSPTPILNMFDIYLLIQWVRALRKMADGDRQEYVFILIILLTRIF